MKFGPVSVYQAEGAILAHSVALPGGKLKKGSFLDAASVAQLMAVGLEEVIVVQLEPGDVAENDAATRLAKALVPDPGGAGLRLENAFTGRVNIRATGPGIAQIDADAIGALNAVDPMITLATVPQWQRVTDGTMVGTVKIISYAVAEAELERACAAGAGALARKPPVLRSASLIVTEIPGVPASAEDKGVRAVLGRLAALGISADAVTIVPHQPGALAKAVAGSCADLVLILTGSATSDPQDVGPSSVVAAGGRITRFGMPVDPGNLLFLGELGTRPVIGLPGCARSPALNGADWVLERVVCGVPVSGADIAAMGVGGLLKEIPSRPQPRERRTEG